MRLRGALVAFALPVVLLSACGDDTGSDDAALSDGEASASVSESASAGDSASGSPKTGSPSTEPSDTSAPPEAPACETVWQGGATLPAPYVGCYEGEEFIAPTKQMCGFGKPLVTYAQRFYAVPDGRIHETQGLDGDKGYARDYGSCTA